MSAGAQTEPHLGAQVLLPAPLICKFPCLQSLREPGAKRDLLSPSCQGQGLAYCAGSGAGEVEKWGWNGRSGLNLGARPTAVTQGAI